IGLAFFDLGSQARFSWVEIDERNSRNTGAEAAIGTDRAAFFDPGSDKDFVFSRQDTSLAAGFAERERTVDDLPPSRGTLIAAKPNVPRSQWLAVEKDGPGHWQAASVISAAND